MYVTQKIFFNLIGKSSAWFDRNIVDGLLSKTGSGTQILAEKIKSFQSGKLQSYTTWYLIGIIVLIGLFTFLIN
jgi:NADH-quinone oxidoreductase subunit L